MRSKWIKTIGIFAGIALLCFACSEKQSFFPIPTEIANFGEESSDSQTKREAWIEKMHRTAPGTSWKAIELKNAKNRIAAMSLTRDANCNPAVQIDDELEGTWYERGSINQAGSVFATDYDADTEMVYTISAGGTLWKGPLSGNQWEVLNQHLRFEVRALKLVQTTENLRIISAINGNPHYSDDDGLTWTAANGVTINNADQAVFRQIKAIEENGEIVLYALGKPNYWDNYQFYRSADLGENWSSMHSFQNYRINRLGFIKTGGSEQLFVLENTNSHDGTLYQWDTTNQTFISHILPDDIQLLNSRGHLVGSWIDDHFELYVMNDEKFLEKSSDLFLTYETSIGRIEDNPWEVGLFQSPSNPDLILSGAVEVMKSVNGAQSFYVQNSWTEYYNDVFGKLHADIMWMEEFQKADGASFILISNHGGLSVSYDQMTTTENIGMVNLNVSQYYSVRTDPINPDVVYAGTQDQGFQRSTFSGNNEVEYFDQIISGDYGHIVFSNSGQAMWTVYPGGWVTYYVNPQNGGHTADFLVDSDNEGNWLPPLAVAEGTATNSIYMAGGNINGGEGSFLITLTYEAGSISATQGDFDFKSNGGEPLSCLAVSSINPKFIYAGTSNGRFFYSTDGGQNFEQAVDFLPTGNYLYGAAIYPSKVNLEKVYFAGSGYDNPAVWVTENNGFSFIPMSDGLPSTLVYDLAATPDEKYLFAATEAGPYIYVSAESIWKPLSGECVPSQTYWSVEYVEATNTVRFGTYGRGIWDFHMPLFVNTDEISAATTNLELFPNPSSEFIQLRNAAFEVKDEGSIYNSAGQLILTLNSDQLNQPIEVAHLPAGSYFLSVTSQGEKQSIPFVKID